MRRRDRHPAGAYDAADSAARGQGDCATGRGISIQAGPAATQQSWVAAPATVVEFAIEQVLQNDTLDALPAVLERLVTAFSGRCALAFQPGAGPPEALQPKAGQPGAGPPPVVLAAHPASAADDQALLSQVGALASAPNDTLNPAPDGTLSPVA